MSCEGELPRFDCAIFADTGWEPAAVYSYLDWLEEIAADHGIPVHRVSAGNIRDDHANPKTTRSGLRSTIPFFVDTGTTSQGMTFRRCTKEYKIDPIDAFVRRELLGLRKGQHAPLNAVSQSFGISLDEMRRMRTARQRWKVNRYPLVEKRMTRLLCLEWMTSRGFPTPPRSACIGCPFHSDSEWRHLKLTSPADFADACEFDKSIRNHAALSGEAYLHRSLRPLEDVDLRNDIDRGQMTLWQDECTGMCGV
jgi:hypothetical protein